MIDKALEAKILRYHFVEQWGVNTIARQLGIPPSVMEQEMYLDLPSAHVLDAPPEPLSTAMVIERYNLALARGILLR